MARLFIDGFESGSFDMWDEVGTASVINSSLSGRKGTYCAEMGSSGYIGKNITSSSEIYLAFRMYPTVFQASIFERVLFYNISGTTVTLLATYGVDSLGHIVVYQGSIYGTLRGTSTNPLTQNAWQLVEYYYKPDTSASGAMHVKINGISEITYNGVSSSTAANITKIKFGIAFGNGFCGYIDNVVIDDATWPGSTEITGLSPTGVGTNTNWDASNTEDNWNCVEEIPASDVDYILTNTADQLDTYATANIGSVSTIKCVQVQARAMKSGDATPVNLKLAIRSNGSDNVSANKAIQSGTPKSVWNLWTTDPGTASAWDESGVNSMEIGIKSAS